jgi:hypothetical protein
MDRRMEDRIAKLCAEFIAEKDPAKARELSAELRHELHCFVETLRAKVVQYPIVDDRRTQSIPSPATLTTVGDSDKQ